MVKLRFTLRQLLKLVVFGAIASACLAPAVQLAGIGVVSWVDCIIAEVVAIPLVMAIAGFPLIRRGPLKTWLIRSLLALSVGIALIVALVYFVFIIADATRQLVLGHPVPWDALTLDTGIVGFLGLSLAFLLRRVVPSRCPGCRHLFLPHDGNVELPNGAKLTGWCVSCQDSAVTVQGVERTAQEASGCSARAPRADRSQMPFTRRI